MNSQQKRTGSGRTLPYLTIAGAWALAFGCSVGWGSFVMPGNTFLPLAGPVGAAVGLGLGAVVMLIIAANYHYLMIRFPGEGGTYTYTKKSFGYDHGFLNAWFLILTYGAVIWANATALPLIARTLLGGAFQFGFHYEIAGYQVYMGELILSIGALVLAALVCLRRRAAAGTQIVMAVLLFAGIVFCFAAAALRTEVAEPFRPAFSEKQGTWSGTLTVFALAPWAYVGFESISHSSGEAKFDLRHSFRIMAGALIAAGAAYGLLSLLSVLALPEGCGSWVEYTESLGNQKGLAAQPAFFAAHSALGPAGSAVLGIAALCGIFTGLIGNFIALSRLLLSMADDGLLPGKLAETDSQRVPRRAILCILLVSVLLPFFGRTAISWIVDVTTVGATIAYAFASAAAWKEAAKEKKRIFVFTGALGMVVSLMFAMEFLIPNIVAVKTLSTESYLILASWGILGLIAFRAVLKHDTGNRLGRSIVAWIVLLGLIIFTSGVWLRQPTDIAVEKSETVIHQNFSAIPADGEDGSVPPAEQKVQQALNNIDSTLGVSLTVQSLLIVVSLVILFNIYAQVQKRERQTEIEKALAEDASRAKTSFLSNMSHEIRTPMNAIIGLDNIALRNPDLQPQTRDQLEKIGASARHLLGLINDILDMSRIESGRMVLKKEEFSFRELMEQINIIISGQCADKGLQYETGVTGPVRDFYIGDDMKLKQVLINILGNAVKFTETPGRVTLTAEAAEEEAGRCVLTFRIQDTGIGMDPEFIPKLFESFSQENATATNRYGGSGLGMAITKNLVDMMNGTIQVESRKGVGSLFTVTVPLGGSDRVLPAGQPEEKAAEVNILAGCRVLMAEDVAQNAEILADLLELEGMEADQAENGEEAVRMFSEKEAGYYDAILMDVRMPVMDGLTATGVIRKLERRDARTIPIIAMTANVFDEDVESSLKAGMNAHLAKPIEPDRLYGVLAELIGKGKEKHEQGR